MHLQISASGTRAEILDALTSQLAQASGRRSGSAAGPADLVGATAVAYAGVRLRDAVDDAASTVAITIVVDVVTPPDPADAVTVADAPAAVA